MKLKTKVDKIKKKIDDLHTELRHIQEICDHARVTKKPRKDEGYAEPTRYYYTVTCDECGKSWTEKQ